MNSAQLESSLERLLRTISPQTAEILDHALSGKNITVEQATRLFDADGSDLLAMIAAADDLRSRTVGDVVTYVINRNINFTNVCVKACGFCAFSRGHLAEEGYYLPLEEIIRRAQEARELGATEVCVQAGLAPGMDGWHYVNLCRALKQELPDLHIHVFSPEEVLYGATLSGATVRDYLIALKEAGVGSLPGTSADILVDAIRQQASPYHIDDDVWICRKLTRQVGSLGQPAANSEAHRRHHRVRAAELRLRRSTHVSSQASGWPAARRKRRRGHENVCSVAADGGQLYSQSSGLP